MTNMSKTKFLSTQKPSVSDEPLTEKDIVYAEDYAGQNNIGRVLHYEDVQSAKRLLKWELLNAEASLQLELFTDNITEREKILYALIRNYCDKIAEIPDACFQIPDMNVREDGWCELCGAGAVESGMHRCEKHIKVR